VYPPQEQSACTKQCVAQRIYNFEHYNLLIYLFDQAWLSKFGLKLIKVLNHVVIFQNLQLNSRYIHFHKMLKYAPNIFSFDNEFLNLLGVND